MSGPDREYIAGRIVDELSEARRYEAQGDGIRARRAREAVDRLLDEYGWLFR